MNINQIDKKDVLYLTIKKVFFDQIISGDKTEEYRDPTDYWIRRLMYVDKNDNVTGFKPFKYVRLCVGYNKDREEALVEIKSIKLFEFVKDIPAGFEKGDTMFTIALSKVIWKK